MSWHLPAVVTLPPLITRPVQRPPQHWLAFVQVSFVCLQNEVAKLHLPPMQPFEQHLASVVQLLPATRQALPLPVTQTLPEHVPLQHWLPWMQLAPRFAQDDVRHG